MKGLVSLVAVALVLTNVSTSKLTQQQAIKMYQDAIVKSESIQSAVLKADINVKMDMGVEQSATVSMSSKMADKGKKMSIVTTTTVDNKSEKSEACVQNGKLYTKQASNNRYLMSDYKTSSSAAINQMAPQNGKNIYSKSLENVKDFEYSQKDGKLNVSYDFSDAACAEIKAEMKALVGDNISVNLKKEFGSAENKASLKESLGLTDSKKDKETLNAMIDAQVELSKEMQKTMLDSLSIDEVSVDAVIDENGYISNQKLSMQVSMDNPLSSIMALLDESDEASDKFEIDMTMNYNLSKIDQNVTVTIPEFNAGNTVAA